MVESWPVTSSWNVRRLSKLYCPTSRSGLVCAPTFQGQNTAASASISPISAGRRMSRGAAKRAFTLEDLAEQTAGVECRKDSGVLDEIPGAYKDIDTVMANQSDLVEVVATLKQVVCIKG